ncbi:hypothetical protein [Sutcliffiella cohnii]|uniref:hypothetical protein n=1 Tax=Sutcliffiella cohnii TaxID=33932 RepID=UPI0012EE6832|nr:hypothetical protein [Sutcliffiella cohnii]
MTQEDVGFIPHTTTAIYVGEDFEEEREGLMIAEDLFLRIDDMHIMVERVNVGEQPKIGADSEVVFGLPWNGRKNAIVDYELIANMSAIDLLLYLKDLSAESEVIKNDWCNECKMQTDLVVTGKTAESIFAKCPHCCAKFDLINDEEAGEHENGN